MKFKFLYKITILYFKKTSTKVQFYHIFLYNFVLAIIIIILIIVSLLKKKKKITPLLFFIVRV